MSANETFLLENAKEYMKEAKQSKLNKSYNSAVTLYFKAIAVLSDLFILQKEGSQKTTQKDLIY